MGSQLSWSGGRGFITSQLQWWTDNKAASTLTLPSPHFPSKLPAREDPVELPNERPRCASVAWNQKPRRHYEEEEQQQEVRRKEGEERR